MIHYWWLAAGPDITKNDDTKMKIRVGPTWSCSNTWLVEGGGGVSSKNCPAHFVTGLSRAPWAGNHRDLIWDLFASDVSTELLAILRGLEKGFTSWRTQTVEVKAPSLNSDVAIMIGMRENEEDATWFRYKRVKRPIRTDLTGPIVSERTGLFWWTIADRTLRNQKNRAVFSSDWNFEF